MDVSTLKSEIKRWERDFRNRNGRDPTIQEIKDRPEIAEKYKLYKKLSKHASNVSKSTPTNPGSSLHPSTPPKSNRESSSSSTIIPKSRAVKTQAPISSSNPFSPVKNKGKQKQFVNDRDTLPQLSGVNPFATPRKSKPRPDGTSRDLSSEPFPLIQPIQSASQPSITQPLSAATTAVMRARKRLRGELVSPSPVKEKRARVGSQSTIPFAMPSTLLEDSDVSDVEDPSHDKRDGPFIEDTPMKPHAGGKAFIQLFQEAAAVQETTARPLARSQSRTQTASSALFGDRKGKSRALSPDSGEEEAFWNGKIKPPKFSSASLTARSPKQQKNGMPNPILPGKDDLWPTDGRTKDNAEPNPALPTSSKRSPSVIELEAKMNSTETFPSSNATAILLPPSPPPPDNSKFSSTRKFEKSKGRGGRGGLVAKKLKSLHGHRGEDSADASSSDNEVSQVKVVDWRVRKHDNDVSESTPKRAVVDFDWDSAPRPTRPSGHIPVETELDPGSIDVSLPDDLKRVLALGPDETKQRESTEDKVAKELLYGSRIRQYNASKGGEIWDIGECESEEGLSGQEDDWEGEPVPWEVGEL